MQFTPTEIPDVIIVDTNAHEDMRGYFVRTFCTQEFHDAGIRFDVKQCNASFNLKKGTLRGLHYQSAPYSEQKLVRCVRGAVFDIVVDLRPTSPTYCKWVGIELSAANLKSLFVPHGCAHGFITYEDNTELFYMMGSEFAPDQSRGVRWDDPAFSILWPMSPIVISERDATYEDFIK